MEERDVASMPSVKAWQKPKTDNLKNAISDAKTLLADVKQKPLLDAISTLLKGATYDIYGDITDLKYRFILDTLIVRIRGVLTEKLKAAGTDEYVAINKLVSEFNKLNLKQLVTIDAKVDDILASSTLITKEEIVLSVKTVVQKVSLATINGKEHKQELTLVLQIFEKRQEYSKTNIAIKNTALQSLSLQQRINKQTKLLEKRQLQIATSNIKRFKMTNLSVKNNISSLDNKIKDQFSNVNSQIDSISDSISRLSIGSFLSGMFSSMTNFLLTPLKVVFFGILTAGKWMLKLPMAIINYTLIKPLKWAFGMILKPFTATLDVIKGFVTNIFDGTKNVVTNVITTFLKSPVGLMAIVWAAGFIWGRWIKPLWENFSKWIQSIDWQKVVDGIKSIWNNITEWWKKTYESIKYIFEPLGEWFGGKKPFKDAFKELWDRLCSELKSWFALVGNKVKEWMFGEEAYEHNKDGTRLKELLEDKDGTILKDGKKFKEVDKSKSWLNLIAGIKIPIEGSILGINYKFEPTIGGILKAILVGIGSLIALNIGSKISTILLLLTGKGLGELAVKGIKGTFKGVVKGTKYLVSGAKNIFTKSAVKPVFDKAAQRLRDPVTGRFVKSAKTAKNAAKLTKTAANAANALSKGSKLLKGAKSIGPALALDLGMDAAFYGYNKALGEKTDADGNVVKAEGIGYDIADTAASMAMMAGPIGMAAGAVIKTGNEIVKQVNALDTINKSFEAKVEEDVKKSLNMWKKNGELRKTSLKDLEANLLNIDYYDKLMNDLEKRVKDTEGKWYGILHPGEHANAVENLEMVKSRREALMKLTRYSNVEALRAAIASMKKPKLDYETTNMLLSAINDAKIQASQTSNENDDKLVLKMQLAINSGNVKLIKLMLELLDGLNKLINKSSLGSSALLLMGNDGFNNAFNDTYADRGVPIK